MPSLIVDSTSHLQKPVNVSSSPSSVSELSTTNSNNNGTQSLSPNENVCYIKK